MSARLAGWLSLLSLATTSQGIAGIPVEQMFRNAEFTSVRLSPDGEYLAAITRTPKAPQARNLVVMEIASRDARVITGYENEDIRDYHWTGADRLLFKVDRGDDDPDKYGEYVGTYSLRRDGKMGRVCHEPFMRDSRSISRSTGAVGGARETLTLLDTLPFEPDFVLAQKYERRYTFPDVYRMNVNNGRMSAVAKNHSNITQWIPDNAGQVRAAIDLVEPSERRQALLYRATDESEWKTLAQFDDSDLFALGFTADNRYLIVASRIGRDRMALFRMDPETGQTGEPMLEDPLYDVYSPTARNVHHLVQTDDGTVAYYQYMADKPVTVFFDSRWAKRQATLDGALPDTVNTIVDWDRGENVFLVNAWSDTVQSSYYAYDQSKGTLTYLLSERAWLDPDLMSPMTPVSYESRDGLTLHGYLTLPAAGPAKDLPLIVHPHGGPYGIRDEWGFNEDVQFLAGLGYSVLQINYRGSGGYGRQFETIGHRKWGLEMQDDITDGVAWAVEQGYADPDRACIYGASYGGYATMMGLVKTPELYRCGINYVGVVDLDMLIVHLHRDFHVAGRQEWLRSWSRMAIGDPGEDAERFRATSPVRHVEKIQAPLLVVHGQLDYRVDIDQYRKLIGELKKHDKPHEAMVKRFEGHGFFAEQNKIELYTAIEAFLDRHNPP